MLIIYKIKINLSHSNFIYKYNKMEEFNHKDTGKRFSFLQEINYKSNSFSFEKKLHFNESANNFNNELKVIFEKMLIESKSVSNKFFEIEKAFFSNEFGLQI